MLCSSVCQLCSIQQIQLVVRGGCRQQAAAARCSVAVQFMSLLLHHSCTTANIVIDINWQNALLALLSLCLYLHCYIACLLLPCCKACHGVLVEPIRRCMTQNSSACTVVICCCTAALLWLAFFSPGLPPVLHCTLLVYPVQDITH